MAAAREFTCADRVRVVFKLCGFSRWGDVTAKRIRDEVRKLKKLSCRTRNHYLAEVRAFCKWMVYDDRVST